MIICGGIFAQVLYNILASILRALGNSKTPLYFLILAALLNIVLDLVFIIVFHMGVAGAAWATITAQGVSGVLCLIYIIKYVPELRLKADDWRFRSETVSYTHLDVYKRQVFKYFQTFYRSVEMKINMLF